MSHVCMPFLNGCALSPCNLTATERLRSQHLHVVDCSGPAHCVIVGDVLCRRNTNRQRADDQLNRLKDQLTLQQFLQECDEVGHAALLSAGQS